METDNITLSIEPQGLFPQPCRLFMAAPLPLEALPFPEERLLVQHAHEKVQQLFAAGRTCAHQAIESLQLPPMPILRDADRAPIWPPQLTGSISHTHGIAVAVVAPKASILSLGVDVEAVDRVVHPNLIKKVASPHEQNWIASDTKIGASHGNGLLRLLSAKEAIFKAFFPLDRKILGFLDAELTPMQGGFSFTLKPSEANAQGEGSSFQILQTVHQGYLFSGLALHAPSHRPSPTHSSSP